MRGCACAGAVLTALLLAGAPALAQDAAQDAPAINLFYDCQGPGCSDLDYLRREIPYVNWMRDREDADVHVLVTSRPTGGGGRAYELQYLGLRGYEGEDQRLLVTTGGDATQDEVRSALAARLAVGLVRYVARTAAVDRIRVTAVAEGEEERGGAAQAGPVDDPWDYWTFRLGVNGFGFGESRVSNFSLNSSGSANRTTEEWKFEMSFRHNRNTNRFELNDSTTIETVREDWSQNLLLVKSLTDHWSVGARAQAGKSTFLNEDLRMSVAPGLEYNVFPYSESSRRSFVFQALLNTRYWDYHEETIFDQTEETRVAASLTSSLELIQPWGRTSVSLTQSNYLHDLAKSRQTLFGSIQVRLFRGFSVNLSGNYSRIRDQLHLEKGDIPDPDVLLRLRQLETDFSYFMSFGVSYRFGSIFNNVVNPRFGEGGGFFIFG